MSKNPQHKISKKFASYPRLNPFAVGKNISAADLIDQALLAYNGGRLREAAQLLAKKMLPNDGYIGMSLMKRKGVVGPDELTFPRPPGLTPLLTPLRT